jgi:hypothetical protein
MTFSSALWRCSRTAYVKSDQRLVNHGHTYWIPDVNGEINVWDYFVKRRVAAVRRGLEYASVEIDGFSVPANSFDDLSRGATCWLLAQSADEMPLPEHSIDVIITDPPYGGNVQYAELSNLSWVWKETGLIDNSKEAVQTRNADFPGAKSPQHYEEMLFRIFRECHRLLKPNGWMVLTFHNRDIGVWMTLHRAANRAGFQLPSSDEDRNRGMVYQAPISVYTTTLHQQATGAMLGDFILSFRRRERPILIGDVLEQLNSEEEGVLRERTQHLIEFHGGADVNTLMTGLLPFLQERGLLHRLARFDFETFFDRYFQRRDGKWYTKEMASRVRPLDFIPAEELVEQVVVSLLHAEKVVTLDMVLVAVYSTLVNSQRPNIEVVNRVLDRVCHEVPMPGQRGRRGFALRSQPRQRGRVRVQPTAVQTGLYSEGQVFGPIRHNEIIGRFVQRAHYLGFDVHVGETEQGKTPELADASVPMVSNIDYGIPLEAFGTIKEIDLLIVRNRVVLAGFEVATTIETANKAVNDRYRNLFASLPGFQMRCYLIVKDEHYEQAAKTLYTPANALEGLSDKVHIVKAGSLTIERIDQLIDPTKAVTPISSQ